MSEQDPSKSPEPLPATQEELAALYDAVLDRCRIGGALLEDSGFGSAEEYQVPDTLYPELAVATPAGNIEHVTSAKLQNNFIDWNNTPESPPSVAIIFEGERTAGDTTIYVSRSIILERIPTNQADPDAGTIEYSVYEEESSVHPDDPVREQKAKDALEQICQQPPTAEQLGAIVAAAFTNEPDEPQILSSIDAQALLAWVTTLPR